MHRCKDVLFVQVSTQLYVHAAGNELLNYLKGLEAEAVKSLTIVSEDGVEAMNTFIHRLLGTHQMCAHLTVVWSTCCQPMIWCCLPGSLGTL